MTSSPSQTREIKEDEGAEERSDSIQSKTKMEFKSKDEKRLEQRLKELHKDVSKKQKFEDAVVSLNSLLRDHYASASPSLRKLYYGVVCRVATVLKTRYTSPGFWASGLALFRLAQSLVSDPAEKAHLLSCISEAQQVVHQENDPPQPSSSPNQGLRDILQKPFFILFCLIRF